MRENISLKNKGISISRQLDKKLTVENRLENGGFGE